MHQDIIYQNATIIKNSFSSLVTEQSLSFKVIIGLFLAGVYNVTIPISFNLHDLIIQTPYEKKS